VQSETALFSERNSTYLLNIVNQISFTHFANKGKKLVEYATAGMDNQLFISKYLLELPKKEVLEAFILNEIKKCT
jgi:hypothetical protein